MREFALRGHAGRRIELLLTRLPDGQVVATARPGRPNPEQGCDASPGAGRGTLRDILEMVPIPLMVWRQADGALLCLNTPAAERFGISFEATTSAAVADCFASPDDYRALVALAASGHHDVPRMRMRASGGSAFWAQASAHEIVFDGSRALLIGLQDITERQAVQEELAKQLHFQETLINTIPSPVFYKDRNGVYLGCNDAFSNYLGLERGQVVGRTAGDIAPQDLAERYNAADEALFNSMHIQVYEGSVQGAAGDRRQVVFYKAPFFDLDGSLGGLIGTMLDITDQKLIEEALRSRGNDLRAILDAGPVGVLITACEHDEILFANARCAEILEISKMGLIGGHAGAHFADPCGRADLLDCLARYGRVRDAEVSMHRRSGRFWALVSVEEIIFDSRRAVLFWIYDISERRKVEEEHRKLFRAVHHSPASVVITDCNGVIEYVNPRFCDITGYSVGEVLGKTPRVCKSGLTAPEIYADLWRTLRAGRTWQGELHNRRKDGSLYWENVLIAPIPRPDGSITHYVAVKSDVTADKQAEQALVEAKERAEDAARAKSEFLAMMSHEIRTPMNGILGMISLLRETPLDEMQRDFTETARASSEALLSILNDILDFSKLEARQMELEGVPLNLHDLIEGVVSLMRSPAEEKGLALDLSLESSTPARVIGDPARLRQVLLNLLSNAIKFTEHGRVGLRAAAGRTGVRFEVSDTGIGVEPDAKEKLFSEFVQADSTIARRFGGTGLGLAICRKIVTLMGGEIGLDSEPGRGSVFWFEVPLPRAGMIPMAEQAGGDVQDGGRTMRALNILLAEDNPVNQKVATALLGRQGHKVSVAKDGFEAVAAVAGGGFDLVLMDVQMPGLDGFGATRQIRALPDGKGALPIVAMTANALKGDEQRCLEAGMDDYVAKPIHPQALSAAIERQCQRLAGVSTEFMVAALDSARLRSLEEQVGSDTMLSLLGDCIDTLPAYMAEAERAAAGGDAAALRDAAHDIKSLAATFGLSDLSALALDVETAAREDRLTDATSPVAELRHRMDAGLSALRRLYPAG